MQFTLATRLRLERWSGVLMGTMLMLGATTAGYTAENNRDCPLAEMVLLTAANEPQQPEDTSAVEERGVPKMIPGRPSPPPLKGAVMEGNRLRALPGYTLDVRPDGGAFMLKPAGGGKGPTGRCNCHLSGPGGGGSCSAKRDGNDGVRCVSKGCDTCSIIIENAAMGGGFRAIQ